MDWTLIHPLWAFGLPILLSVPLGRFMWRMLDVADESAGKGFDALPMFLCRLLGRSGPARMDWKRYGTAMLLFHAALFLITFCLLYSQQWLPLNPNGKGSLGALGFKDSTGVQHDGADTCVVFNTVCSFITNTNMQHYSGEQHLSYFSQLGSVMWMQFVTPAASLAIMLATLRGLRGDKHLGDFYLDVMRVLAAILIPLSMIVALALNATGVPMTFQSSIKATTLEGTEQIIARGPAAAMVAIKQLGTNGGGFFGTNSTHPFENPTPWSNLIELTSIIVLPMSSIVLAGLMLRNRRHAMVLYGVMLAFALAGAAIAIQAEFQPNAATAVAGVKSGPNMEGKEARLGPVASATWAAITCASSNGAVNSMHASLNPVGGAVPLSLMMLNVAFSGIGAGFENMLMYVIIAVFIAGLMVGRTPEYLGRKVEVREVKLAMVAVLIHPLIICLGTAIFASSAWSAFCSNPGPHGFSEILYEFTSAAANNGSGFEGLADNNPAWNIATGIVLLLGRFPSLILPLAVAGCLSVKKPAPRTSGSLRTDDLTFACMLMGTILLVGALSFMPAVVLGPIADQVSTLPR